MAADQRRKRSNGAAVADVSRLERSRSKKRHYGSALENGLNMKSHISLEWDEKRKKVAAKKAQVGISWRELKPFVKSYPQGDRILADAFDIPQEIFQLENLDDVLSHEVWQSYISESERKYLMQFLPAESDAQQIVKPLLGGDNFHFGNPFTKWSASLLSGNLHPDSVLHREKDLKDNKKAYYLELEKYHKDMIGYLLKLKERWEKCEDPEEDFNQNTWSRSKKNAAKNFSSPANGLRFDDVEESVGATSESSSWAAEEKASTSDNQTTSMIKGVKLQKRMGKKGPLDRSRKPSVVSTCALNQVTKSKKGDKLRKRNIVYSDGAEYMSYVKISKKQHELAKSMEKSGSIAQSQSLNPVLGNLDNLDVKPYEVYLEEERKKLHKHWMLLAKEDLPSLCSAWRNIQSQRQCIVESLGKELLNKIDIVGEGTQEEEKSPDSMLLHKQGDSAQDDVPQEEDEIGSSSGISQSDKESVGAEYSSDSEDDEESAPGILPERGCDTATLHTDITKNQEQSSPAGFLEGQDHDAAAFHIETMKNHEDEPVQDSPPDAKVACTTNQVSTIDGDSPVPSTSDDQPGEIPPLNSSSSHAYNLADLEVANNPFNSKSVDTPLPVPAYSGNLNSSSIIGNQAVPLSSGSDAWQSVNMADSYYGSDHPPVNKPQQRDWTDLESDLCERETQKNLLHRQVNENSFKSFPDGGQNELLHSIFKGQDVMSYSHEQKGNQTNFQSTNNVLIGNGRFPRQFDEQPRIPLPLDQELKIQNDLYMQHNMSGNLFPDGDRFSMQRQEHMFPVNVQDWGVNSACGSTPVSLPPPLPGADLSSQNWFSHEHQARGGWTNSDGVGASSQSIGNSVNLDQSLYSVLSHCNQLHPGTSYDSIPQTEHFIPPRDYGLVGGGLSNVPNINNVLPHTAHSLEYLNRREPPGSLMNNDTGWMGLPNQNPNLNDPMGKPFLGSWNR